MKVFQATCAAAILAMAAATPALADFFTTSSTVGGHNVTASANVTYSGGTLTIQLTNTTSGLSYLDQVLTDFHFALAGAHNLSITNVSVPNNFYDCSTGGCSLVTTFHDYLHNKDLTSPYGWSTISDGIAAGNGSFKPAGIVNNSVTSASIPSAQGGLANDQHNDYLNGPVTFTLSYTGTPTGLTVSSFSWGTTGTTTDAVLSSVPEPTSVLLLATVLLGTTGLLKRKLAHRP